MDWNEHGGECCGVSHVLNFPYRADRAELDRYVKRAIEATEEPARENVEEDLKAYRENPEYWGELRPHTIRGKFGHLIEVCLTDDQMAEWASTLKEYGFRLGPRWLNDNSGNYCNLLTYQTKQPSKPRPFEW